MMGTWLHVRIRLQTSRPSRSGRPRSKTMTSGGRMAASVSPCFPVSAVCTSWPRASSPTWHTLSRLGSSSMMRMCAKFRLLVQGNGNREGEAELGSAFGGVFYPDVLSVRFDKSLGDGESKASAGIILSPGEEFEDLVASMGADA